MVTTLDKALQAMTIEENKPLKLKNLPKFSSCERNVCSLMGRLLCPENQKMSRFIHDMPRLWHVSNRARGIALSEDTFQFIFDSEHDLETVLHGGAWTYEDWSMVLERWVEKPPEDYLKILPLWIRLRNIPVNYYTVETFEEIAETIGQVLTVAFDPLKPQSKGYVRVQILFDVNKPLWNSKEVELPTGETVSIGIEYERVRKRCFQCQRLIHDRTRCPFNPQNRQSHATGGIKAINNGPGISSLQLKSNDPLFGVLTNDDVGIDAVTGRPKISKEVLDEMRSYLSVSDPTEKQARIDRVRKSVWNLEGDPKGQKTLLRLEPATEITTDINKGKGLVFDFDIKKDSANNAAGEKLLASAIKAGNDSKRFGPLQSPQPELPASTLHFGPCSTVFESGGHASSSGTSATLKKYRRRPSQHKRKAQANKDARDTRKTELIYREKVKHDGEAGLNLKRKAVEEGLSSPKIAKRSENDLAVVPYEEPPKQEMRRDHFPDILFLLETKNSSHHVLNVKQWLGYDFAHIVDPEGLSGGLALFWKASYDVEVLHSDKRIIDTKVKIGSLWFFVSFVYGDPACNLRQEVWDNLTRIGLTRNEPWFVVGDLNEIWDNSEKFGGPARDESSFIPFRNMIQDCRLRDVPFSGNMFSWAGKRNDMWIQIRLDRALGNAEWFHLFPRVQSEYLERVGSDHRPLLTRFVSENQTFVGRFMFDKRWTSKPETTEVVRQGWNSQSRSGHSSLFDRIAACRKSLSLWKRSSQLNSKTKIKQLRGKLDEEGCKQFPRFFLIQKWRGELAEAYREEEVYWKQKSHENWLHDGDRNTKYFHGCVQGKRAKNKIFSLIDDNGVEQFADGSKGNIAVDYFQKMFTSSQPCDATTLLDGMSPRVTPAMNTALTKPVTNEEIRQAVFAIRSSSAPGADGMTGLFFQSYWSIVGQQVCEEVKNFFESGSFPVEWNFTQICLLPKKPNPNRMTDLRPISLCSVSYKIVSKILCSRLKAWLPEIVSDAQGAFVSGRLISDNILLAHEMVHALRTNPECNEDFMAIKTDMSKAYDRVEWNFLEELFIRLGFDRKWVDWIMTCVRSVTYSVLLNGNSYGFIKPERGIRQGDPLSPFLFILCAEALVHTMNKAEIEGRITGLRLTRNCPSIQHLLFADDSLFLCRANFKEGAEILQCLKLYGDASGQEINLQKSSIIYGAKMEPIMRHLLGLFLGILKEGGDGMYLGLPECFSGSKCDLLAYITKKLKTRLTGWYAKTLSLGGKEVLLKSVAMALPVYAMSCFKLTKYQCQQITSAMTSFWWNSCEERKKMHWVSWEKMCKTRKDGGLGFRDVGDFNQALLAKQAWRLLTKPSSLLARVYKARYYHRKGFMDATIGSRPSYAWRSIIHGRDLLEKGLIKNIGNGQSTSVWTDKWIFDNAPRRPFNKQSLFDLDLRVSNLITTQGSWNQALLSELFFPPDVVRIMSYPPNVAVSDSFIWAYNRSGCYTVKSGNWLISHLQPAPAPISVPEQESRALKMKIWAIKTVPKIQMFLWRALSGALAVSVCLQAHGMNAELKCPLCQDAVESISHVLFHCWPAREVWEITNIPLPVQGFNDSVNDNLAFVLKVMNNDGVPLNMRMAIPWIIWGIWKHRNEVLYAGKQGDLNALVVHALEEAEMWNTVSAAQRQSLANTTQPISRGTRWTLPPLDMLKCNIHVSWLNDTHMCGGAWIVRNNHGDAVFHAREMFLPSSNRIAAELRGILWMLQSLHDLHLDNIEVWSDCNAAIEAIVDSSNWPRYHSYLDRIHRLLSAFGKVIFKSSSPKANAIARDIATSVTRDGRVQSYLARGGPTWLLSRIEAEKRR
ncbi:Reverse transcriptase zinc-binding domain [Arabidopsis thaliana x Arabidopsis arenosa]|uniref:Reverse transcriptase zinc-binding domain n=1 Tax=Arabidopsis thaliana x Arabidopsis arenosa TaxID=1240361 RepID=A0A8T2BM96_9BRAS|nr:Reverse transcriptase zinc-binding domain [Arabidopsis thaliana x Arabidopsis arenosa]